MQGLPSDPELAEHLALPVLGDLSPRPPGAKVVASSQNGLFARWGEGGGEDLVENISPGTTVPPLPPHEAATTLNEVSERTANLF